MLAFLPVTFLPFDTLVKASIISGGALIFSLVMFWGASQIHSQMFVRAICHNKSKQQSVAITFDDGPDSEKTPQIIALLREFNAKASFFVIGSKLAHNKELLTLIHNEGHTIGNHSYLHGATFSIMSAGKIRNEITRTQEEIRSIIGCENKYFRPPYGVTNPLIAKALRGLGLKVIGWNIRSLDTAVSKEKAVSRVIHSVKGGDIILLHDTTKDIVWIVNEILIHLHKNNLNAVTIDELLS